MNIPIGQWSGSDATKELQVTLLHVAEENSKQTRQMVRLTWAIVVLTVAMLSAVGVQIALCVG